MKTKALELKDVTETGEVEAVVATLNVIDKDRDVTEQGFFGTQDTKIVSGHDWSQILLGKGTVTDESGREAVFAGRLNLDDSAAEQLHSKLRFDMAHPPPMIEWSYGYKILPGGSRSGQFDDQDVQFLQGLEDGKPGGLIYEVSPVLVGSGEGTRTLAVKQAGTELVTALLDLGLSTKDLGDLAERFRFPWEQDDLFGDGTKQKFADHLTGVLASVDTALDRAESIKTLRADQGHETPLGSETLDLLIRLGENLDRLKTVLAVDTDPDSPEHEWLAFQRTLHMINS